MEGVRLPRSFLVVWFALGLSAMGDVLFLTAVTWFATASHGVVSAALGIGLAQFLPAALLAPFSGVLVDRLPRYRVLVWTDLARFGIAGALAAIVAVAQLSLGLLIVGIVVLRLTGLMFSPALASTLGNLASSEEQLIRLNAWVLAATMIAGLLGPLLAGWTIQLGIGPVLAVNAVTFLVSALAIVQSRHSLPTAEYRAVADWGQVFQGWWSGAVQGVTALRGDPVLPRLVPTFPIVDLVGAGLALLLPGLLLVSGAASALWYGALVATWAGGRFLGLILARTLLVRIGRGPMLALNAVLQGAAVIAIASAPGPAQMLPFFLAIGIPSGCASVAVNVYIQTKVGAEFRGRVFSLLSAIVSVAVPLGPVLAAAITASHSPQGALFLLGGLLAMAGMPALLSRAIWVMR